ncbi:glucan -beta-glucosidase [Colletotrichum plurivorum]|uniref:Glucan -beta-glucosidase n=1 Tax=Colletotrichum plurivorum TaxID=2175906 RepID=A0A8H6MW15_9PEZI|nr:glucan -beta-glucosidase [Colletotrichum plurivorum]
MAHHQEPMDHHQVPQDDSDYSSGNEDALADIIEAEANECFASLQAPEIAHQIPQELYEKAMKENDQLTDDERRILLSRGDVTGKALAHPASLTPEERNFRAEWESRQQAEWKKRLEEQKGQMMRGDIWKEYNQKIDEIKREAEASGWPEDERMRRNFIAAERLQIKQERSDKGLKATDDSEDAKDWSDRIRENVALSFYRDETYDERARLQRENAPGVFSRYAEDLLTKWWDAMSKEERAVYLAKAGDIEQW